MIYGFTLPGTMADWFMEEIDKATYEITRTGNDFVVEFVNLNLFIKTMCTVLHDYEFIENHFAPGTEFFGLLEFAADHSERLGSADYERISVLLAENFNFTRLTHLEVKEEKFSGIHGTIFFPDMKLDFKITDAATIQENVDAKAHAEVAGEEFILKDTVDYTLVYEEDGAQKIESVSGADAESFMKALAISLHYDGMPNAEADYEDAEKIMELTHYRWIA